MNNRAGSRNGCIACGPTIAGRHDGGSSPSSTSPTGPRPHHSTHRTEPARQSSLTAKQLEHDHFKLLIFVGASQARLPFELAASLQRLGDRAEYIKISGNGSNALDFHIAYYIGQLATTDPSAYFHIISKDSGFDPLIQHLRSKKILAGRAPAIAEIPLVKNSNCKSADERLDVVIEKLRQQKAAKPATVKTLSSTIVSLFQKRVSEAEAAELVQGLAERGYVAVNGTKVTYALPKGPHAPGGNGVKPKALAPTVT